MNKAPYIIDRTSGSIAIYVEGVPYSVGKDHCNYKKVLDKLRNDDHEDLEALLDIPSAIANASEGKIVVDDGMIFYNGEEIHNTIVDRILEFIDEGFPFEPLALFLENLLKNPNEDTIKECYEFLETGKLPITEDGCFLAYKKVDENFKSHHASPDGTHLDHSIGAEVEMDRDEVDTNRDNTCSKGLHFCSLSYLSHFGYEDSRTVVVKVNPRDVCAIPSDYNNAKGRTSYYEVVAEYDAENRNSEEAFEDAYVDTTEGVRDAMTHVREEQTVEVDASDDSWGVKPNGHRYNNNRINGRFAKRS
jgi:hypothetical protein